MCNAYKAEVDCLKKIVDFKKNGKKSVQSELIVVIFYC